MNGGGCVVWILLVVAAVIDARWRRFPNWLAAACAVVAFTEVWLECGARAAMVRLLAAVAVCGAILVLELFWRRLRHTAGLGLGDIKALFALVLYRPFQAVAAFAAALVLLAVACLVANRRSLPLLPFLVPVFVIMCFVATVCA